MSLSSSSEMQFRHLSFKYPGTERYVIKDLNVTIKAGETVEIELDIEPIIKDSQDAIDIDLIGNIGGECSHIVME